MQAYVLPEGYGGENSSTSTCCLGPQENGRTCWGPERCTVHSLASLSAFMEDILTQNKGFSGFLSGSTGGSLADIFALPGDPREML